VTTRVPPRLHTGRQVEEMAGFGWLRVSPKVAEKLFEQGVPVALLGARDPAKKSPRTSRRSAISWEMAVHLEDSRRADLPARDRKLVFYVKAPSGEP
jgi:hypothetical protein